MTDEINTKLPEILQFGVFRYDRSVGQLTDAEGTNVHLRRQSADVLSVLAEHAGDIVTKTTLFEEVWPGIATTDDSLVQCIADIRRVLGRDVVKTFPKKGYKLELDLAPERPVAKAGSGKPFWLALAGCLAAVGTLLYVVFPSAPTSDDQTVIPPVISSENTLAVLPFVHLGTGPELRFFGDGLSTDLATDLSKVPKLTVISYASSFDYSGAESGFKKIAKDLGVRYLVRGTVRQNADRIRINVSLIDTLDGFNVWAERFDRDKRNPFDVQAEVTREIVDALSLTLNSGERAPQRIEPDAHFMLLRGLEPLREYTERGNLEARRYFERALAFDPEYARAYAKIAITYGRETVFRSSDEISKASIEKGLEAAITAIQLDPDIPHAYFALGVLNLAIRQHDNAMAATRHALKLDRNYSDGYALLAEIAVYSGDLEEALIAIQRAKLLHPHHPPSFHWIEGQILFHLGRYDDAQPFLEAAVEGNPRFYQGLIALAANYGQQRETKAAKAVLEKALAIKPELKLDKELAQTSYNIEERRQRLAEGLKKAGIH
jgi:TolB-like protein/DNA-binding winged helix-turn-helix (wHTH) protein/cytochrome c-type biogenesis protein CcmH/NrfG